MGARLIPGLLPLHEVTVGEAAASATDHGYVFVRNLIDPADVRALRLRVLEVCEDLGWLAPGAPIEIGMARPGARIGVRDAAWTELQRRVAVLTEFAGLREHHGIHGVLERIFDATPRSGCGDICRVLPPDAPELTTSPHQDGFYLRGRTGLWTAWIPLGDCPAELGGLAVAPASHLDGLLHHAADGADSTGVDTGPDIVWASADYRSGDVLFFHNLTLHRARENRSAGRLRVSVDFRYEPAAPGTSPQATTA